MNDVDALLRARLHRAGDEMAARPLHPAATLGERLPRRTLRPLMAAVAMAVVVGVAGGLGVHARLSASRHTAPATTPPPVPSPVAPSAAPTPVAWPAAPFGSGALVAWDSTHRVIVAYRGGGSPKSGASDNTWTWGPNGWQQQQPAHWPNYLGDGMLVDVPALHGVVLLSPNDGHGASPWLWDGTDWRALPAAGYGTCFSPQRAAWDARHQQLVAVLPDQCSATAAPLPTQVWTWDGHTWRRHNDLPNDSSILGDLAWDPSAGAVVMLGTPGQEWTWSGSVWTTRSVAVPAGVAPTELVGAAWDARAGGLLAYGPPAWLSTTTGHLVELRNGAWSQPPAAAHPERVMAVLADGNDGRMLVIGQEPVAGDSTPSPRTELAPYFVLAWTGNGWQHVTYADIGTAG